MAFARSNASLRHYLRLISASEGAHFRNASRRPAPFTPLTSATSNTIPIIICARSFSITSQLGKKRKIAAPRQEVEEEEEVEEPQGRRKGKNAPPETVESTVDALDFSALTAAFGPIDTHFKSALQTLSRGGRFNPDSLGALTVTVKSEVRATDGSGKMETVIEDFPLSELAQVVPRSGRSISLLVNERDYIKPIMSAVQACKDVNQQPQRSDDNDLELLLKVEMERKEDVVKRVKETTQTWRERIRSAKTKHEKYLKGLIKNKAITVDMGKKAEKELQRLQDKKMKDIDDDEAKTIKAIGR